ncbi:MAG: phenylalanine--tRNA ligase subunit alpha [Patescibacteria group bacterium]|nr:phenylalanine--tRNA ligase subunit alpha [Patescibacteria group bacterium]
MQTVNLKTKSEIKQEIEGANNLNELNKIFKKYLGKKGEIAQILRSIKNLSDNDKKEQGRKANDLKNEINLLIKERTKKLQITGAEMKNEWFDFTIPGKKPIQGHLHPLTLTKRKFQEIFQEMGFSIAEGTEIESEWYNFDALNIPKNHPARDLWDTFWIKDKSIKKANGKSEKLLLRTHTSPNQVRYMEKNNPPLRIIVPGRIFRHEATDASHEINFYQLEGLMLGKDVSVANFKAIIKEFFSRFFEKEIKIRLRPSYFPFTEPSFEIDISCLNCNGKGCSVCQKTGWVELMGAGMVHPNVLKAAGINYKNWQGFAFGMGIDRLAMMKYKIEDVRLFYEGDLRFLEQF